MTSANFVRRAALVLALCGLLGAAARASTTTVPNAIVPPRGAGSPPWTFNVKVQVDHIPAAFPAIGVECYVHDSAGLAIGAGYASTPLSNGAFSGTLPVPAHAFAGAHPEFGAAWNCALYLQYTNGTRTNPHPGEPLSMPKPGTVFIDNTQGSLPH